MRPTSRLAALDWLSTLSPAHVRAHAAGESTHFLGHNRSGYTLDLRGVLLDLILSSETDAISCRLHEHADFTVCVVERGDPRAKGRSRGLQTFAVLETRSLDGTEKSERAVECLALAAVELLVSRLEKLGA